MDETVTGSGRHGLSDAPPALLAHCLIPYAPGSQPALHGVPVVLPGEDGSTSEGDPSICLARNVMEAACRQLGAFFSSPAVTAEADHAQATVPVVALCSPHLDGTLVPDAAIRYIGCRLEADIIVLDPAELAKGSAGVYGKVYSDAFWLLYDAHYQAMMQEQQTREPLRSQETNDSETSTDARVEQPIRHPSSCAINSDSLSVRSSPAPIDAVSNVTLSPGPHPADTKALTPVDTEEAAPRRVLKDDPRLRVAVEAVRSFVQLGSAQSNAPTCRRILYLRDFGSFNKVFLPWLSALAAALASSPRTVVVAGISPVSRTSTAPAPVVQSPSLASVPLPTSPPPSEPAPSVASATPTAPPTFATSPRPSDSLASQGDNAMPGPQRSKHERFVDRLRKRDLGQYLDTKFGAQWRMPLRKSTFEGLEDVFTTAFVHRYQGEGLAPRSRSQPLARYHPPMSFALVLRVCMAGHLAPEVREASIAETSQRFMAANVRLLSQSASIDGKVLQLTAVEGDWSALQGPETARFRRDIGSFILPKDQLDEIIVGLPQTSGLRELIMAYNADVEWRLQLDTVTQMGMVVPDMSGGFTSRKTTEDPLVSKIKRDPNLDPRERELLGCVVDPTQIRDTFEDVCVPPQVLDGLRTAIQLPLLFPTAYESGILSLESGSGVLLYGPPGTGKTMACRALAKECGARMLLIQSSNVLHELVGVSEKIITAIFSLARRLGPCIVLFDELDAMFGARTSKTPLWHVSMLTEFMLEMDGFLTADLNREKGVFIVGATNRPQDLDHAVLRRLPRRILVDLPGIQERQRILEHYLRTETVDDAVDVHQLAIHTRMFSGSDLKQLVLAAAQCALKESAELAWGSDHARKTEQTELRPRVIRPIHIKVARKEITASNFANHKALEEMRRWGRGERVAPSQEQPPLHLHLGVPPSWAE